MLAVAGMVFLASAIAVLAIAALVLSRPLETAADAGSSPELRSALQTTRAPGAERRETAGDSPVSPAEAITDTGNLTESPSLGSIRIAAIGLDAKYYSGVHDAVVARGPGLWPGTPLPGIAGNSVFAGHRTTHTHPFKDLDLLEPGDLIEATRGSVAVAEFRVVSVETVRESEYVEYALAGPDAAGTASITLLACAPKGLRTHRIVVRAAASTPAKSLKRGDA